jgi:hemolysin activation/secretion protein
MRALRTALVVLTAAFLLHASGALAQAPGAGVVAPPASPIPSIQPGQQPTVKPPPVLQPEPEAPVEAGPPVHVTAVSIEGATVYPPDALRALVGGLEGATVPRGDIADAVRSVQTKYRNDGYFLTVVRGVLEPVANGARLRVIVIEGYISSVKIDGDAGPVEVLIYNYLNHLTQLRPTRNADLERYALLAQNVPGVTVRIVLRAARDEPGAIEVVAQVERKALDAVVVDDNRGPETAGPNELLMGVGANSFTSAGERTQLFLFNSPFNKGQIFGQASLDGFVGSEGLKVGTYVGYSIAEPGDVLAPIGYKSRLLLVGGSASYPVIRTRPLSLSLNGALDVKEAEIDLRGMDGDHHRASNEHLVVARLGETLELQDDLLGAGHAAADSLAVTVHHGLQQMFGLSNGPSPARPGENNNFTKATTEIIRVQSLAAWGTKSLALKIAFAGQWTANILPPSEKYFLGGQQYGRGFFSGEVTGDRAAAGTLELQLNDSAIFAHFGQTVELGLQYYGFYDIGQTYASTRSDLNEHIESAGLGVRVNIQPRVALELEGVDRFTRRPAATTGSVMPELAIYFRVLLRY